MHGGAELGGDSGQGCVQEVIGAVGVVSHVMYETRVGAWEAKVASGINGAGERDGGFF